MNLFARVVRLPLRCIPHRAVMPFLSGPRGYRWIAGASTHGCWLGTYEKVKRRRFQHAIRTGDVVYDVGANAGFYTLLASHRVGDKGCVVAIEPHPRNVEYLRRHIGLNKISNVIVVAAAAGDESGVVSFDDGPNRSQGQVIATGARKVDAITLDTLVLGRQLPAPQVIKIDVEGAENRVLAGSITILKTVRPIVFIATHGAARHRESCEMLSSLGYVLEPLDSVAVHDASEIIATPR